ncbi:NRDE family protein [Thermoactinospora rubra]|uniref:NRDE family protein n=1 Tax=Thermoactinospora rubra TaxID=1088767 RepID=UPI001301F7E7|nr:NRDE family protein [Thermoactinospora rubra]
MIVRPGKLMGIRDEFADRPWEGPGEHWPEEYPGVVGGRDLKAGGTWLAVHRAGGRVAALLNGRGVMAEETVRVSRGDLPLRAVVAGGLPEADLSRYDPFHLVLADSSGARLWSWDGVRLSRTGLPDETVMIVNTGLDPDSPRVRAHLPRFRATDDWWSLTREEPSSAPEALILRHELPDGRVFASLSITQVTPGTYEFHDLGGHIGSNP